MPHRGETEAQAETRRLAFEERRVQRVDGHIWELERDHPEIFRAVEQNIIHVPYYGTKAEQDQFLNSIADTQIGFEMLRLQTKWNKDYRIPLILPRFENFPNITINEQQWLAMMGTWIDVTAQTISATRKPDAFKRIEQAKTEIGTGFKRGQAYQAPITEPAAVTITEPLLPEISFLPEVYAEPAPITSVLPAPTLSPKIKKIIDDWSVKKIIVPAWFANNNMNWVLEGRITEQEFLDAYTNLVNTGAITFVKDPEPIVDQVSTNMIRQELLNFTIVNNRIQGSIKFIATDAFNPYFYNKPITNYLQLKSVDLPNWTQISTTNPKSNRLTFTETQRDEVITFDEDAQNLTFVSAESFIDPAMSEVFAFTIEAGKEPTVPSKPGLMGAGVLGIIGILMLGGFIADHVRRKR